MKKDDKKGSSLFEYVSRLAASGRKKEQLAATDGKLAFASDYEALREDGEAVCVAHCPECQSQITIIQRSRYKSSGPDGFILACIRCDATLHIPLNGSCKDSELVSGALPLARYDNEGDKKRLLKRAGFS